MTTNRLQHIVPATAILLLAGIVIWISFTQEPAEAFLFPRIIATAMLVLALWNFARASLGLARVGSGIEKSSILALLPGLGIMLIYIFSAAKGLGFYVSSAIAFMVIYSLYDPASHTSSAAWLKRLAVTLLFMAIIYGLFALLLKVQTPRGLFF